MASPTSHALGEATFYHLHFKQALPPTVCCNTTYHLALMLSNEIDMFLPDVWNAMTDYQTVPVRLTLIPAQSAAGNKAQSPYKYTATQAMPTIDISQRTKPVIVNGAVKLDISFSATNAASQRYHLAVSVPASHPVSQRTLTAVSMEFTLSSKKSSPAKASRDTVSDILHAFPVHGRSGMQLVLLKEVLGSAIGLRIYDCGLYLRTFIHSHAMQQLSLHHGLTELSKTHGSVNVSQHIFDWLAGKRVLELGSGVGIVGLDLYANALTYARDSKQQKPEHTSLTLTDLSDCLPTLTTNVIDNCLRFGTAVSSTTDSMVVHIRQLLFGSHDDMQQLPTPTYDLIIGSDILFNSIYFDDLVLTLNTVAHQHTQVLLAYRPRGSDVAHKDVVFFDSMLQRGWSYRVLYRYENVFIILMAKQHDCAAGSAARCHHTDDPKLQQSLLLPFQQTNF